MKSLESRKQLLIAESELNRASLDWEWHCMVGEVHALRGRAETIVSMTKAAVTLISGISSLCGNKPPTATKKFSWWPAILKGAGLAGSFWSDLRGKDRTG
jgi:hypothetical protein